ncbi:MAG: ABC-2 family transporter protein, partial [bacterium]
FIGQQMAESLGYKLLSLFISLPSFLLLFLLMGSNIELNLGFATLAVFLVAVVFGFLLNFLFDFVLSVAAFYTTTAWWILHIKLISITILGGLSFPLSLFPEKVQQILNFLPFGYFVYFPTRVISMGASELDLLLPFGVMIFWVAIFAFLYKILWRLGLKKFTAVGI